MHGYIKYDDLSATYYIAIVLQTGVSTMLQSHLFTEEVCISF